MSKIGIQSQNGTIVDFVKIMQKKPIAYKLLGNALNMGIARTIRDMSPQTFLVLRSGGNWAVDDPNFIKRYADEAAAACDPYLAAGLCDMIEPPNEPVVQTVELAKMLNDAQVQFAQIMQARGYEAGAYNFSVGNPDYPLWPHLLDGIRASNHWLLLHEYGAPFMQSSFVDLALRHRKVFTLFPPDIQQRLKIGVTESGIDLGSIGSAGGYRRMPLPSPSASPIDEFLKQMDWYEAELAKDPYVLFVTLFGYAMNEPWVSLGFDLAQEEEDRTKFRQWLQGGAIQLLTPVTPLPVPPPVPDPPLPVPPTPLPVPPAPLPVPPTPLPVPPTPLPIPPMPLPAPPLSVPVVKSDDELRNLAYNISRISYNPDSALVKWARAKGLGVALAAESTYVDAAGTRWVWQPFVLGIARCISGDWGNIKKIDW